MDVKKLQKWMQYLKDKEHDVPGLLNKEEYLTHWTGRLYLGTILFREFNEYQIAYDILRDVYVENKMRYSSDFFGSYEDYIEEKVNFFKDLAQLSHIITKEADQSIPYIDEALIMLDATESVSPYVDHKEFANLKKYYIEKLKEE